MFTLNDNLTLGDSPSGEISVQNFFIYDSKMIFWSLDVKINTDHPQQTTRDFHPV